MGGVEKSEWWEVEVGRYGCQNDGLDEADTMGGMKRRERGRGGREGGRKGRDIP